MIDDTEIQQKLNEAKNLDALLKKIFYNNAYKENFFDVSIVSKIPSLNYFKELVPTIDRLVIEKRLSESDSKRILTNSSLLKVNLLCFQGLIMQAFIHDTALNRMLEQIVTKEEALHKQDCYTFLHTLKNSYGPLMAFDRFLRQNKSPNNNNLTSLDPKNIVIDNCNNQNILIVNRALFDNFQNQNYCPSFNIVNNEQQNATFNKKPTWRRLFKFHQIDNLYSKYRLELHELQKEFHEISKYGSCSIISIPASKIKEHAYLSDRFGNKIKIFIEGIGETDDIQIIIDYFDEHPEFRNLFLAYQELLMKKIFAILRKILLQFIELLLQTKKN